MARLAWLLALILSWTPLSARSDEVESSEKIVAPAAPASPWAVPPEGSCSPEAGLRGWPLGEDVPAATLEPGDVIDLERLRTLRDYLPAPIWEHRDRFFFEGMSLEIGPCFRDYEAPAFFGEATEKFEGQAQVLENGGLAGYTAGLPFPPETISADDPKAGIKWAWNVEHRYRGGGFRGDFRISDLVGRMGRAEPFEGEIFVYELNHRADRPQEGYRVADTGDRQWVAGGRFFTPFNAREYAWRQYRPDESLTNAARSDDLHVYVPEMRKVRRAPAHLVEGLFMPSFNVGVTFPTNAPALGMGGELGQVGALGAAPDVIQTRRNGFEGLAGRPLLYQWTALGTQDLLAPINAVKPAYPEVKNRDFGPWGLSWASDRWDLRRAIVLEARNRDPDGEVGVSRYHLWADLQTLTPLYYVAYDNRGEQVDVGYFVGRWSEDRPAYPKWPDDPGRQARIIDSVGAAFANLKLQGSWRRESWDIVSIPESDKAVRRSLSIRNLQSGR